MEHHVEAETHVDYPVDLDAVANRRIQRRLADRLFDHPPERRITVQPRVDRPLPAGDRPRPRLCTSPPRPPASGGAQVDDPGLPVDCPDATGQTEPPDARVGAHCADQPGELRIDAPEAGLVGTTGRRSRRTPAGPDQLPTSNPLWTSLLVQDRQAHLGVGGGGGIGGGSGSSCGWSVGSGLRQRLVPPLVPDASGCRGSPPPPSAPAARTPTAAEPTPRTTTRAATGAAPTRGGAGSR